MLLSIPMWCITHKNVGMISDVFVENHTLPSLKKKNCQNREGPKYDDPYQILQYLSFVCLTY